VYQHHSGACIHTTNGTMNITCINIVVVQTHNKLDTNQRHVDQHYNGASIEQRKQSKTSCASTLSITTTRNITINNFCIDIVTMQTNRTLNVICINNAITQGSHNKQDNH